ncbi:uncharacterized protein SPSK_00605 [Sporothrix schenckii 1099-18]|uniref:Uncharacterized protein n=1 Tax=Sporothrix schenckii 1099-18 TaxID=1397361 RepID=A0A0F2LTW4_SPOSC|nr:uncharacterized protein SPSK_00605 [Sporothrix schenckii 1099-18]KJR79935.1 hypothetical protein SPSK_00605 [Sporothrix schenckii 1099-18]
MAPIISSASLHVINGTHPHYDRLKVAAAAVTPVTPGATSTGAPNDGITSITVLGYAHKQCHQGPPAEVVTDTNSAVHPTMLGNYVEANNRARIGSSIQSNVGTNVSVPASTSQYILDEQYLVTVSAQTKVPVKSAKKKPIKKSAFCTPDVLQRREQSLNEHSHQV